MKEKERIVITEEMQLEQKWFENAKKQTLETLPAFMNHILNDFCHDYGTICHAISACALAAVWAADNSEQGGVTGFQAGFIMWDFVKQWQYKDNRTGLKIINYDDMLYPQYKFKFVEKSISQKTWKNLQNEAKRLLEKDRDFADARVLEHWESIVSGVVPFGYNVTED